MAFIALPLTIACNKEIDYDASGQIDATKVVVSAETNGKILSLSIEEGDKVCAGQTIGVIDSLQTYLQAVELRQRIEGAKTRIVDIEKQIKPNRNQLTSLENDLARYSKLLESNAATQKQVDDLNDKIAILKAQISAQIQSWELSNANVRSDILTFEIQLSQKEDQLKKCTITIPSDGTVLTKYAEEGENVTSGKSLVKIANLENTYVRAYFTTTQLADLKIGDILTVIPDDGSASPKELKGCLTWISDQAEFTPKNIQTRDERADMVYAVKVSVPNDGSLRLGMYAYVRK